jgi:hypothetical protein
MVPLAKLLRIRQEIGKKYKNIGLEKFRLSISWYLKLLEKVYLSRVSKLPDF